MGVFLCVCSLFSLPSCCGSSHIPYLPVLITKDFPWFSFSKLSKLSDMCLISIIRKCKIKMHDEHLNSPDVYGG